MLKIIGRDSLLFSNDISDNLEILNDTIKSSSFLVIGGAGSIGQSVVKEIFKRKPKKLDVVDLSENNLTELVRDIRSSLGYIDGKFKTYAIDVGSVEYDAFINSDGKYDYVINLSALKHVRSEEDPYTLMRMIDVNIFNTEKTIQHSIENGAKKYFSVSTDKATNPANFMGATKLIMEMFLMKRSKEINVSSARFANVAFSEGSLLSSLNYRLEKMQPIGAPNDIKRYFMTAQESGELCLLSCILGENRDIFFPKLNEKFHLVSIYEIVNRFLNENGYEAHICNTENEARKLISSLPSQGKWPCFFSKSDTTGEKSFEEFHTNREIIDMQRFEDLGIIKSNTRYDQQKLNDFKDSINQIKMSNSWDKNLVLQEFLKIIPDFNYHDLGKYLDEKM